MSIQQMELSKWTQTLTKKPYKENIYPHTQKVGLTTVHSYKCRMGGISSTIVHHIIREGNTDYLRDNNSKATKITREIITTL